MYKMSTPLTHFAADFDCNAYGSGTYDNSTCATAEPVGAPDTGVMGVIQNPFMIGGVLLVIVAVVLAIRTLRRPKKQ